MKKLYFFFLICINSCLFGQNNEYSLVVKDIETLLPIENVTVVVLKTKQILVTNKLGKVSFELNGSSSIEVSEIAYEPETVRWAVLQKNEFVVYIKSKDNKLDEIIVSKENPQKTLQKIVTNSIRALTLPARLKVYVREFFKFNDIYSYYNDGLVNFQFTNDQKKIKTVLLIEQNRSYGLTENFNGEDLLGYNLNNIMENYISFKYLEPLLNSKIIKDYDFLIKGMASNKNYQLLSAIPKTGTEGKLDNYEVIYDVDKKIIIQYTIKVASNRLSDSKEKQGSSSKNYTKSIVNVSYRLTNSDYFFIRSKEEISFYVVEKDKIKRYEVQNDFFSTHFDRKKFTYNDNDVFKEKTLFNKKNKILTNYWDVSGFTATDEEKKIVESLEYKL
ncbi:hypothetical protein [Flavobacterium sp.]|uniref:hypothetical protein n=1 Tax=Flavobacterium sp. TaxID=239 RepID=UPI003C66DEA7